MKFLFVCLILLFLGCEYSNPSQKLNDTEIVQKPLQDTIVEYVRDLCVLSYDSFYIDGVKYIDLNVSKLKFDDIYFAETEEDVDQYGTINIYKGIYFQVIKNKMEDMTFMTFIDFKDLKANFKYSTHNLDSNTTIDSFMIWFPKAFSKKRNWQQAKYVTLVFGEGLNGIPMPELDSHWEILFIDGRLSTLDYWFPD